MVAMLILPILARAGKTAVAIPQAREINTVFEPGISLMLW